VLDVLINRWALLGVTEHAVRRWEHHTPPPALRLRSRTPTPAAASPCTAPAPDP